MCYKYLWDNLAADDFPSEKFFTYFGLNPQYNLCQDLKVISSDSGFSASTLDDVVGYYRNTCRMLAPAHDQLLLSRLFVERCCMSNHGSPPNPNQGTAMEPKKTRMRRWLGYVSPVNELRKRPIKAPQGNEGLKVRRK